MRAPTPTPDDLRLIDPDDSFRQRLAADRLAITQLLEAGDRDSITPIVHRLAGAAGTFGFAEVSEIAMAMDDAMAQGTLPALADIERLVAALARTEKSA